MKPPAHELRRTHGGYATAELRAQVIPPGYGGGDEEPDDPDNMIGQGIGAEAIHDDQPNVMGRGTRRAIPLDTHEGAAARPTDYGHPGERGFRFKSRHDGV